MMQHKVNPAQFVISSMLLRDGEAAAGGNF